MGYRLHYAEKYDVKWAGGAFNHQSYEFSQMALAELGMYDSGYGDADASEFELYVEDVKEYITKLRKEPDAKNEYFDGEYSMTNAEVADELQEMVDGTPRGDDYIHLAWF